jgi:hypothetical protein
MLKKREFRLICPFMSMFWLLNKDSTLCRSIDKLDNECEGRQENTFDIQNLPDCKEARCGVWKQGQCGLIR